MADLSPSRVENRQRMFDCDLNPFRIMAGLAGHLSSDFNAMARGEAALDGYERLAMHGMWSLAREAALRLSGTAGLPLGKTDQELTAVDSAYRAVLKAIEAGDDAASTDDLDSASVRLYDLGLLTECAWYKNYSWNPDKVWSAAAQGNREAVVVESNGKPDGPQGGCWLWWKGNRHDVPKGNVYKLIDYFWNRESARYDDLVGPVFDSDVLNQSIRSECSETSEVLSRIGVPWKLSADSRSRIVTKKPTT
jgi:hypothetical protein